MNVQNYNHLELPTLYTIKAHFNVNRLLIFFSVEYSIVLDHIHYKHSLRKSLGQVMY